MQPHACFSCSHSTINTLHRIPLAVCTPADLEGLCSIYFPFFPIDLFSTNLSIALCGQHLNMSRAPATILSSPSVSKHLLKKRKRKDLLVMSYLILSLVRTCSLVYKISLCFKHTCFKGYKCAHLKIYCDI